VISGFTGLTEAFMLNKGFIVERMKSVYSSCGNETAELYAFIEGSSLWKFFPFEDHIFFYDLDVKIRKSADGMSNLHSISRSWVDARFKIPKWRRYKVPNIVTVGYSSGGFDREMISLVSKHPPYGVGGEKHSMFLVDISERTFYSAGIEKTSATAVTGGAVASVTISPGRVNPSNRAYHLINELVSCMQ